MSAWREKVRFRQLSIFLEVARRQSFVRTAEALNVTQPSVSRTISELEEVLEVRLFERSRRGVWLTPEGEAFRHHAGAAISAIRRGVIAARATTEEGQRFKIGALPTVAGRLVPAAVQLAVEQGLRARLSVLTGPNTFLLGELKSGNLDLVVGRLPQAAAMDGLEFERLFSDRIALVTRVGHPMSRPGASLSELVNYPVLLPGPGALIHDQIQRALVGAGLPSLNNVVETVSPGFAISYLQATNATWIISESVVQDQVEEGRLVAISLGSRTALGPVGLTRQTAPVPSPFMEDVCAAFRREASRLHPSESDNRFDM